MLLSLYSYNEFPLSIDTKILLLVWKLFCFLTCLCLWNLDLGVISYWPYILAYRLLLPNCPCYLWFCTVYFFLVNIVIFWYVVWYVNEVWLIECYYVHVWHHDPVYPAGQVHKSGSEQILPLKQVCVQIAVNVNIQSITLILVIFIQHNFKAKRTN